MTARAVVALCLLLATTTAFFLPIPTRNSLSSLSSSPGESSPRDSSPPEGAPLDTPLDTRRGVCSAHKAAQENDSEWYAQFLKDMAMDNEPDVLSQPFTNQAPSKPKTRNRVRTRQDSFRWPSPSPAPQYSAQQYSLRDPDRRGGGGFFDDGTGAPPPPPSPQRRRRPSRQRKSGPPPPDSEHPLWPKLRDFKSMLRRESELRLDLLGPWAADVVKDEADWRLELYKGWLKLLDEGVGEDVIGLQPDYPWYEENEVVRPPQRPTQSTTGARRRRRRRTETSKSDVSKWESEEPYEDDSGY